MISCFQEMEGSTNHCCLSLAIMRETERTSHQVWSQQDAWRFKQFCIPLKCLYVDTDGGNACGFDGACKVTDRYMAGGSACRQENGIDMGVLEHLGPLRGRFVTQPGNIRQSLKRVVVFCHCPNDTLLRQFTEACQRKHHVDVLLGGANVVGDMACS